MKFCFFDLDGTLADTDADIRLAWKAAIADLGLECPAFDEKFVAGPPIDEMARILFPDIFTPSMADDIRVRFASHYDNDGFPTTKEYPGVMDAVRSLKKTGHAVAIVTNKRFSPTVIMSRRFGWDSMFDGVFAGDMFLEPDVAARFGVEVGKVRKPELLRRVMAFFGAKPENCAMVGDTANDFEAARENGVFSVGVAWGYGKAGELDAADAVCETPRRLAEILG